MSRTTRDASAARRRYHAAVFAALGDETRLALVSSLSGGQPRSIAQLTGGSRLTRQAITKHLRVLESAGTVHGVRAGRESGFELDPAPLNELKDHLGRLSEQRAQRRARRHGLGES